MIVSLNWFVLRCFQMSQSSTEAAAADRFPQTGLNIHSPSTVILLLIQNINAIIKMELSAAAFYPLHVTARGRGDPVYWDRSLL